jgi:peptide deformylase
MPEELLEEEDEVHGQTVEPAEPLDPEVEARRQAALSRVRKFGDPVLRSKARPVEVFDESLANEIERMGELMRDALGVGLAATQVGVLHRVLVFQAGLDAPVTPVVNPEVEWTSEELESAVEGCLSLPSVVVDVERPLHVRVRGADGSGEPVLIEASGLEARVLQHEIDHLDGVLIIDRTDREQRKEAMRILRDGPAPVDPVREQ